MTISKHKIFSASHIANEKMDGWLENHSVVVEGSSIKEIIHNSKLTTEIISKFELTDLGRCFLLPGLIETHAHVQFSATPVAYDLYFKETPKQIRKRAEINSNTALLSGVTTMRDLGAPNELIFDLKKDIDRGKILGPKILPTGTPITIDQGHCWFFGTIANSSQEIFKVIENQLNLGATHIKIMASGGYFTPSSNPRISQYSPSIIKDTVEFCESNGTYLCAHTLSKESTVACVEMGVHNIIHGRWFDKSTEKAYSFDKKYSKIMADRNIFVDSTISKHLLEYESKIRGEEQREPNPNVSKTEPNLKEIIEIFRILDEDGVKIIGALDMGMSKAAFNKTVASAWAHVEWLGFDHWKALRSITTVNAEALRIEKNTGRIKQNYVADFVSFESNPINHIRNLTFNPKDVIKDGVLIKVKYKSVN